MFLKNKLINAISINAYVSDVSQICDINDDAIIDYSDIVKYFNSSVLSPITLRRHKSAIKHAIKNYFYPQLTSIQEAEIDCFFNKIKLKYHDSRKGKTFLSEKEIITLLNNSGPKTKCIIMALYEGALRVSELIKIKITDCVLHGEYVSIDVIGKFNKRRTIYISKKTFDLIVDLYNSRDYLFQTQTGHISRHAVYMAIMRIGYKFKMHIHPHMLRRSFASNNSGKIDICVMSEYMGHASPAYTAKDYIYSRRNILPISSIIGSIWK
jgi:integrase